MNACFDDNQLLELAEGSASAALFAQLDSHLDTCEKCRRAVADVMRSDAARADYPLLLEVDSQHYVLEQELARGGMGRIRVAHDRRLGREVAVKEMLATGPEAVARFEREARITARLQHPSIVHLYEAGVWPSGEPFYAMQLIHGRSLDEVIGAAKTFEARVALLPNVLAVADAMASAHAARVVHRDLKPRNVLIGSFGETVVIDWGLAKDLEEEEQSTPAAASSPGLGSVETERGSVLGTPAYMPPEQAAGLAVDERADVYAIGAMLDHLLSGAPPYEGTNAQVLAAVKAGPPVALAVRQPGLPEDLAGVVARAMDREPARRYPSARELADDLRRYLTGQLVGAHRYSAPQLLMRWLRRHRAAVSVAAIALGALLTVSAFALRSVLSARDLAEQRRARAEDLVGFMLVDLRERLKPIGKLEILDAVTRKAVGYYGQQDEGLGDEELARQGVARRSLGDVLQAQGHPTEAAREFRAALAIAQKRHAQAPGDDARARELVASQQRLITLMQAEGDLDAAAALNLESLRLSEALAKKSPSDDLTMRLLGINQISRGYLLRAQGDLPGALESYRAALATCSVVASRSPTSVFRGDLALAHGSLGGALAARGDAQAAQRSYEAALAIREQLVADDPSNAWSRVGLASGLLSVGDGLLAQGDSAGALLRYRRAVGLCEQSVSADPTNAERERELAGARDKVAGLLFAQGAVAEAHELYLASLSTRQRLFDADPKSTARKQDLAVSLSDLGDVLLQRGEEVAAMEKLRAALVIDQQLVASDARNTLWQRNLMLDYQHLGLPLLASGDAPAALELFESSLALAEALTKRDPADVVLQEDLADAQENVADALLAQGDGVRAAQMYRRALETLTALTQRDPTSEVWAARAKDLAGKAAP